MTIDMKMLLFFNLMNGCIKLKIDQKSPSPKGARNETPTLLLVQDTFIVQWKWG